jgi:hypothetical protein
MKSKEEIEQLADFKYQHFTNEATQNHFKLGFYDGYTQCQEDMVDTSKVTNVEIIHQHGSRYRRNNCKVELSYHDDGKTLRVIVSSLNKQD